MNVSRFMRLTLELAGVVRGGRASQFLFFAARRRSPSKLFVALSLQVFEFCDEHEAQDD